MRDRILLIDDEMDAVHVLRFALERAAFEVICVVAEEDALASAIASEPHLVLLGLEIGACDRRNHEAHPLARNIERRFSQAGAQRVEEFGHGKGAHLCRKLRLDPRTRDLPIVLMTGHSRADSQTVEGFKAGADDYIAKPFRPAEVVARVRALLNQRRDVASRFDLPGADVLEKRLQHELASGAKFGTLHTDLLDFSDFNTRCGTHQGDRLLHLVARILQESAACVAPEALLCHQGSDRFVIVAAPETLEPLAHDILLRYNKAPRENESRQNALHSVPRSTELRAASGDARRNARDATLETALANAHGDDSDSRFEPRLGSTEVPAHEYSCADAWPRLGLAGVSNEARRFRNPLEIASVALEIKRALRNRPASSFLKDRRSGEYDPQRAPHSL